MTTAVSNLTLIPWWTCDVACHHCVFESSPKVTGKLDLNDALRFIEEACADQPIKRVTVTGGEPFLDFEYIQALSMKCYEQDVEFRVVTNGSFATSVDVAVSMLRKLQAFRLDSVGLSWDHFHLRFINPELPRNLIRAARKVGTFVQITVVTDNNHNIFDALQPLQDEAYEIPVVQVKCLPIGRAKKKVQIEQLPSHPRSTLGRACKNDFDTATITHDNRVYPCCAVGGFTNGISLGKYKQGNFKELQKRKCSELRWQILAAQGPHALVQKLSPDELQELGLDQAEHDCVTCNKLFTSRLGEIAMKRMETEVSRSTDKILSKWKG